MGFSAEELINIQKPFAYLPNVRATRRKRPIPLNHRYQFIPANYNGICRSCGNLVQKAKPNTVCKMCKGISCTTKIPKNLKPWPLIPPGVAGESRFSCTQCGTIYCNTAYFLSLCSHREHGWGSIYTWVCRFCCSRTSKKALAKISNYWEQAEAQPTTQPTVKLKKRLIQTEGILQWDMQERERAARQTFTFGATGRPVGNTRGLDGQGQVLWTGGGMAEPGLYAAPAPDLFRVDAALDPNIYIEDEEADF